jgi:hypothetical protein
MRILYINSHLVFNVYLNISIVFCWYFIFQVKNLSNKKWKISFYIFSIILMLYFLVISEGRMGIITCLCLLFFIIAYKLWKVHKLYVLIFILFAPFVAWLLLSNHKRSTPSEIKKDAHYYIWYAALDVIKDQPIVGYGASRAQEVFDVSMDKFETTRAYKVAWKENKILHCQNQFFQTYMEFGIIGMILLIYLICAPLFIATDKRRALAISLMFIIVAQFTTEIVLTFQGFPVIFGILTLIMLVIKDKNSQ